MGAIAYENKIYPAGSTAAKDSVFDNTGTGLSATNAEDAIKEVNSNISAHDFGQYAGIPYDTDYIAPSDGYVTGYFDGSNPNNFVIVKINGEQLIYYKVGATVNAYPAMSLYVKKGMVIRIQGTNGSGTFFSLV